MTGENLGANYLPQRCLLHVYASFIGNTTIRRITRSLCVLLFLFSGIFRVHNVSLLTNVSKSHATKCEVVLKKICVCLEGKTIRKMKARERRGQTFSIIHVDSFTVLYSIRLPWSRYKGLQPCRRSTTKTILPPFCYPCR